MKSRTLEAVEYIARLRFAADSPHLKWEQASEEVRKQYLKAANQPAIAPRHAPQRDLARR